MAVSEDILQYDKMVENALRGVVREALMVAADRGLPGNHHFYITFRTNQPGVVVPDRVREKHPVEMTIVLQHQYWDLTVGLDLFEVTLSFNRINERLRIPFAAVTAFADPSSKFGLQFQNELDELQPEAEVESFPTDAMADERPQPPTIGPADDKPAGEKTGGEVIALDAWRKK